MWRKARCTRGCGKKQPACLSPKHQVTRGGRDLGALKRKRPLPRDGSLRCFFQSAVRKLTCCMDIRPWWAVVYAQAYTNPTHRTHLHTRWCSKRGAPENPYSFRGVSSAAVDACSRAMTVRSQRTTSAYGSHTSLPPCLVTKRGAFTRRLGLGASILRHHHL